MGSILSALNNSAGALKAYGSAFSVLQNNIANANTPGFVRQDQILVSLPFQEGGAPGGVTVGPLLSSRSPYLERNVQYQQTLLGDASQRVGDLSAIEPQFAIGENAGLPASINQFFAEFSSLAVNPNDTVARQAVLDQADSTAAAFRQAGLGLKQATANADAQTTSTVASINDLAQRIADINGEYRKNASGATDPSLDAQLHANLENLASLTNFTTVRTQDGEVNVYLGGQTPLVQADQLKAIHASIGSNGTQIVDDLGHDVTSLVNSGQLHALLQAKNTTLPSYSASLNQLATAFADSVNATLASGVDKNGVTPAVPLFSYDSSGGAAYTLTTNGLAPDDLAAASAGAPGGNGNAIAISQLATAQVVGGLTFAQAYGNLGAQVGRDLAFAKQDKSQFQDTLTQAQAYRTDQTGVSLDAEAAKLLQLQQAYEAVGKLVGVLNQMTQTVLAMIQT
ncbi:MAG: flagellar hook-associated protein FlgK [Acidobacteriota bacterium]